MYLCQLSFDCLIDVEIDEVQPLISALLDEYRYNGQIIGREFPLLINEGRFEALMVCPEQDSLAVQFNNEKVTQSYQAIVDAGLALPEFALKGLECQSDFSDICDQPGAYVLYSTYVQSCSPIRCMDHFSPVPLYKLPESCRKPLIKWQESQAGCDQLQMNELIAMESAAVRQLSNHDSELMAKGRQAIDIITAKTHIPVYLYLYRVGGESRELELKRKCPGCNSEWLLEQPMFGLFDFKCDVCQLVSNLSWDWQ